MISAVPTIPNVLKEMMADEEAVTDLVWSALNGDEDQVANMVSQNNEMINDFAKVCKTHPHKSRIGHTDAPRRSACSQVDYLFYS